MVDERWRGYNMEPDDPPCFRQLTSAALADWILRHKIIETVFGPGCHVEMIRRSPALLIFLAQLKRLEPAHIDAMWKASLGVHATQTLAVHEAIAAPGPPIPPSPYPTPMLTSDK